MQTIFKILMSALIAFAYASSATLAGTHPFDDLTSDEIASTIAIIRASGKFDDDIRFPILRRLDVPKKDWLSGKAERVRKAYVAIFDFKKSMLSEVVVDLNAKELVTVKGLPGLKPPVLLEEYERARKLVHSDERWRKAVVSRGVKIEDAWVDLWAPGLIRSDETSSGQRLLRGLTYVKGTAKNFYARPLEGLIVNVDLSRGVVSSVWDVERPVLATGTQELVPAASLSTLKPLEARQPEGTSIEVSGQELRWHNWRIRWSMDPMQGLQLYLVRYVDGGRERSILHRLSMADMIVPYGDPAKSWSFRNAFDVGEYGLGKLAHPLKRGEDVPENALLFDVALPDDLGGKPVLIPAVAAFERDGGILWKHRDSESGETAIARARQLVLTYMTTIGNYDYGVNYIFDLDGTIHVEPQLTGILLAKGTDIAVNRCSGGCLPLVEKNILAPPHQHLFNFRIDLDIDGANSNRAAEVDVRAIEKGPRNPDANGFEAIVRELTHERGAVRDLNPKSARKWKVFSSIAKNALGHPTGYMLMPAETAFPYLAPSSQMRQRARFIEHPIWFTAYHDDELSGASRFPTTAPAGEGLPRYIADDESLRDQDVVLWYTFGVTHVPRPEEWPVMNTHHTGFSLMPMNFFSRNPMVAGN